MSAPIINQHARACQSSSRHHHAQCKMPDALLHFHTRAGVPSTVSYEQYYDALNVKEVDWCELLPISEQPLPVPKMCGKTGIDENSDMIPSIMTALSKLPGAKLVQAGAGAGLRSGQRS